MNDKELLAKVRQAYKERKTKDLPEEELIKSLRESGLTQEETKQAIHTAIKNEKIRFCYLSSIGYGKVPCYERITKRDILPQEILDEMFKHTYHLNPKAIITTKPSTKTTANQTPDHVSYITAYCRYCGKRIKHTVTDGIATCLKCYTQFPYKKQQNKKN